MILIIIINVLFLILLSAAYPGPGQWGSSFNKDAQTLLSLATCTNFRGDPEVLRQLRDIISPVCLLHARFFL